MSIYGICTFATTSAAIKWYTAAKATMPNTKLIPIPSFLKAGCGFACLFQNTKNEETENWIKANDVRYEALIEVRYENGNISPCK